MLFACSPTENQGCGCGEVDDVGDTEVFDEAVFELPFPFHGVDYAFWDPDVHETYLTTEGKKNLLRVVGALRSAPDQGVMIQGFCGPPVSKKMIDLATKRTRVVHTFLKERGCSNRFEFSSIGFKDGHDKGPCVGLMLIQPPAPVVPEVKALPVVREVQPAEEEVVVPVVVPAAPVKEPEPYQTLSFLDAAESPFVRTWNDKPLGFTYSRDKTPVQVTKVVKGSRADLLGIQAGMRITGVEFTGRDMTSVENKGYAEVNDLLVKGVTVLPHETDRPYLAITFSQPSWDEMLLKTWYTRPLGFSFHPQLPVCVSKVEEGSRAWELGVTEGMYIKSVAYTDMPIAAEVGGGKYTDFERMMETAMSALAPAS